MSLLHCEWCGKYDDARQSGRNPYYDPCKDCQDTGIVHPYTHRYWLSGQPLAMLGQSIEEEHDGSPPDP